ncbi:hypothetical protein WJX77_002038 [Trebouxia sp. C0004]
MQATDSQDKQAMQLQCKCWKHWQLKLVQNNDYCHHSSPQLVLTNDNETATCLDAEGYIHSKRAACKHKEGPNDTSLYLI